MDTIQTVDDNRSELSTWTCRSQSLEQTLDLGQTLGGVLVGGTVLALSGQMGAGKTHFTQGIAMGLGVDRKLVNSPTFSLVQEYAGRLPIFHFDTYRLRSVDEFLELGFDEYLAARGVCIIEWADRVVEVLPKDRLTLRISVESETSRRFDWQAGGTISQSILDAIRAAWPRPQEENC